MRERVSELADIELAFSNNLPHIERMVNRVFREPASARD